MSFSHNTVRGAAKVITKKGDSWLGRMGIDVFGLRSGAGAAAPVVPPAPAPPPPAESADEKAKRDYKEAGWIIDDGYKHLDLADRDKNAAVIALGPAFKALPHPQPSNLVTDFVEELASIQPKLQAARMISAIYMAEARKEKAEAIAGKAEIQARNPQMQFQDTGALRTAVADARARRDAAAKKGDILAADEANAEVQKLSEDILRPYDTLMALDKNKKLFDQADAVLAAVKPAKGDKAGIAAAASTASAYAELVQKLQDALSSGDHKAAAKLLSERIREATEIVRKSFEPAAQMWDRTDAQRDTYLSGRLSEIEIKYRNALADGFELKGIKRSEAAAILSYSKGGYKAMNDLLRRAPDPATMDDYDKKTRAEIDEICRALDKLPKYDPTAFPLFRWEVPYKQDASSSGPAIDYMESRYKEGQVFVVPELWSTGGGGGADALTDVGTVEIVIWGKPAGSRAKDVSMLTSPGKSEGGRTDKAQLKGQAAGEALFPPGTKFKTMKVHKFTADGSDRLQRRDATGVETGRAFQYRIEVMEVD